MPRRSRPAAVTALVLALAGCGTTVPTGATGLGGGLGAAGSQGADAGLSAPGDPSLGGALEAGAGAAQATGEAGAGAQAGAGASREVSGAVGSTAGPSSGATSSGGSAGAVAGDGAVSGRGFTKDVIRIGYATADDYDAFAKTLPAQGLDAGDPKGQMKAVVDDLNKRGGILGRKVELVAHDFNSAQAVSDPSSANEAACSTWTQDKPVHVVVLPALVTDNLLQCLHKARTPLVHSGVEFPRKYSPTYQRYPGYFFISTMVGERFDMLAVSRLKARGYFAPWDDLAGREGGTKPVRVGVIIRNDDEFDVQVASTKRAFAAHGLAPASIDRCPANINTSNCMQGLALRYKANGITHVYGNSDLFFMNTADSQAYRPRYFIPGSLDLFAQNAPGDQLVGAMGESFLPTADVPTGKDPGPPTTATTRCFDLMKRSGQTAPSRLAQTGMLATCDVIWFIEAALERRGALSDVALVLGLESLGTSTPSAMTWSTRLASDQHAGTGGLRDLSFDRDCRCFFYTSSRTYTK